MKAKSGGEVEASRGALAVWKILKRIKETVTLGRRPKRTYVSYKTESGQMRYVESEMRGGLPGSRSGGADG